MLMSALLRRPGRVPRKNLARQPIRVTGVVREPSEETLAAIAEAEAGDVKRFNSLEELMADLDNADE